MTELDLNFDKPMISEAPVTKIQNQGSWRKSISGAYDLGSY